MNSIYYIIIALIVLIVMLLSVKHEMIKIANKDLNKMLIGKQNTTEEYFFANEKTGNIYLINTLNGKLYLCSKYNDTANIRKSIQETKFLKNKSDFKLLTENYYKIIENDISFDINDLT